MRKNPCINCWSSFPSSHEMLLWASAGVVLSLLITGLAAIEMI
ncbi:MAG: hypothetical protein ACF8LL_15520 [Phycisphaerales bacterium]